MTNKTIYGTTPFVSSIDNRYHYVYRITNLVEGKHYYGVKTTEKSPYLVMGKSYFGSPKQEKNKWIKQDQKDNPTNYKYKILQCFETRTEASGFEVFIHKKFNVKNHFKFYNEQNQTQTGFDMSGKKLQNETKAKQYVKKIGKMWYTNISTNKTKKFIPGTETQGFIKGRLAPEDQLIRMQKGAQNFKWITHIITKEQKMVDLDHILDKNWSPGRYENISDDRRIQMSINAKTQYLKHKASGEYDSIREKIKLSNAINFDLSIKHAVILLGYETEIDLYRDLCYDVYCKNFCHTDLLIKYKYNKPHHNYPSMSTFLRIYDIKPKKGKTGPKR